MNDHEAHDPRVGGELKLRLYVVGASAVSRRAISNVRQFTENLKGWEATLEVVDLAEDPKRASRDGIIAIPSLIRLVPQPERRVVGDMENIERLGDALGLSQGGE